MLPIIRREKGPELMKTRRMERTRKVVSFNNHYRYIVLSVLLQESFILQKLKRRRKQWTAVLRRLTPIGDVKVHWLNKTQSFKLKLN